MWNRKVASNENRPHLQTARSGDYGRLGRSAANDRLGLQANGSLAGRTRHRTAPPRSLVVKELFEKGGFGLRRGNALSAPLYWQSSATSPRRPSDLRSGLQEVEKGLGPASKTPSEFFEGVREDDRYTPSLAPQGGFDFAEVRVKSRWTCDPPRIVVMTSAVRRMRKTPRRLPHCRGRTPPIQTVYPSPRTPSTAPPL